MNDYTLAIATHLRLPPEDVKMDLEKINEAWFDVYYHNDDLLVPYEDSYEPEYCYREQLVKDFEYANPPGVYGGYIDWQRIGDDLMSDVSYDCISITKQQVLEWLEQCFEMYEYTEEEREELLEIANRFNIIYIHIFGGTL